MILSFLLSVLLVSFVSNCVQGVKYVPTLIEVSLAFERRSLHNNFFLFFSFLASVLLRTRGWAICLWEIYVYFIFCFSLDYRYELAEECADDDDARISISNLMKAVLEELKMHDSFVQVQCSHAFCYLLNCQETVGKQNKLED